MISATSESKQPEKFKSWKINVPRAEIVWSKKSEN